MFVMPFCAGNHTGSCQGENGGYAGIYRLILQGNGELSDPPNQLNPQLGPLTGFERLCPKKHKGLPAQTLLATSRGSAWIGATQKTLSDPDCVLFASGNHSGHVRREGDPRGGEHGLVKAFGSLASCRLQSSLRGGPVAGGEFTPRSPVPRPRSQDESTVYDLPRILFLLTCCSSVAM